VKFIGPDIYLKERMETELKLTKISEICSEA